MVSNIFCFHPYLGTWPHWTSIFFNWVEATNLIIFQEFACFRHGLEQGTTTSTKDTRPIWSNDIMLLGIKTFKNWEVLGGASARFLRHIWQHLDHWNPKDAQITRIFAFQLDLLFWTAIYMGNCNLNKFLLQWAPGIVWGSETSSQKCLATLPVGSH